MLPLWIVHKVVCQVVVEFIFKFLINEVLAKSEYVHFNVVYSIVLINANER